jgi:hypothetical protein
MTVVYGLIVILITFLMAHALYKVVERFKK